MKVVVDKMSTTRKSKKPQKELPAKNNTNERYVRRAERYAMGVDAADEIEPGIKKRVTFWFY